MIHTFQVGQLAVAVDWRMRLVAIGVFAISGNSDRHRKPVTTQRNGIVQVAGK